MIRIVSFLEKLKEIVRLFLDSEKEIIAVASSGKAIYIRKITAYCRLAAEW